MKNSWIRNIYIHIFKALIISLVLFTVFSAVGINKVVADDTSTITIIKKTNDNTNKDFKFRIKAYKTTETTSYEYKEVMRIMAVYVERSFVTFVTGEDDFGFEGYTFIRKSYYRPGYDDCDYSCYISSLGRYGNPIDDDGYTYWGVYDMEHHLDYVGPSHDTLVYNPELHRDVYQTDVAPDEYPNLMVEEEFNSYRSAIDNLVKALYYDTENEENSDGYYKNRHSITYKGESYPIYSLNNYSNAPSPDWYYIMPESFGDEPGSPLFIRLENKTTETTYLDLSFDSRFTSIGDNVYEFTVKANDSTGVTIDIPVGYTYEIEEVEDSDYTLKSINDDDVFDVKGEMGTGAETFTFFNESKDEPTPVEPTPRVDKPKYNLPKTGIE